MIVKHVCGSLLALAVGILSCDGVAQNVSREEFNRVKKQLEGLQSKAVTEDSLDDLSTEIQNSLRSSLSDGTTSFLVSGYGQSTFAAPEGGISNFGATFNPIFVWNLADNLRFEAELEVELEDNMTLFGLEYAQLSYDACDYLTVSAGKFLNPFGVFRERLHSAWVNKMPDKPLGYSGGANKLVPSTQVGAQVRGSYPFGGVGADFEVNYVVYVVNGVGIKTAAGKEGLLNLGRVTDNNQNKSVGGRVGIAYQAGIEVGVSYETQQAKSAAPTVGDADVTFFGIDANLHREIDPLQGTVDFRSEYVRSKVDTLTYVGAGAYDNERDAIYFQGAYRPTKAGNEFLKNTEIAVRYDMIDHPSGAKVPGKDEDRLTFGITHWMGESTALKIAYRQSNVTGGKDQDVFLMQWAMGF